MSHSLFDTLKFTVSVDYTAWLSKRIKSASLPEKPQPSHFKPLLKPYTCILGKFGGRASIRFNAAASTLTIECSPAKLLTGQNLFGSNDLCETVLAVTIYICEKLGIKLRPAEVAAIRAGEFELWRVDIASHVRLEDQDAVPRLIRALKTQLAFTRKSVSNYRNETLYVNQHGKNWSLKFYDKYKELAAHPLPDDVPHRELVMKTSRRLLRVELVLRRPYLVKHGLTRGAAWSAERARDLLVGAVAALKLTEPALLHFERVEDLSNTANSLLAAHMAGVDVSAVAGSARVFADHRRAILAATGMDLRVPFEGQLKSVGLGLDQLHLRLGFGQHPQAALHGITAALVAARPPRQQPAPSRPRILF